MRGGEDVKVGRKEAVNEGRKRDEIGRKEGRKEAIKEKKEGMRYERREGDH